jgi:hypothetical protein
MTAQAEPMHDADSADEVKFCVRCGYPIDANEKAIPVPDGHRRVTNLEVDRIFNALMTLSQRRLATGQSEKKIATLLRRYFDVPYQVFEQQKKMVMMRNSLSPDSEDRGIPASIGELRQMGLHALLQDTQDIPDVPDHLLLTEVDMPKPLKGEAGDANQAGVANIKFQLGFLYQLDEEDEENG